MTPFEFQPIGFIETCFAEKFGTPRQPGLAPTSWGKLRLRPELNLSDAFHGLEGFSHLWLVFVFHQNTNKGIKTKVRPPRMGGEKMGLFATRTPHRPNPIGLSAVCLDGIEGGDTLILSGLDLVSGTPILDIKPYLPTSDSIPLARSGWTQAKPERSIEVVITAEAQADFMRLTGARSERFQKLAREVLELDPRPTFYKGTSENPNPYTAAYGFRLEDFNVVYTMEGSLATVIEVQKWNEFRPATRL
jgi:tRNA-Thr(GGU) m(6)t(6)A37 methyltransferase TsaA